MQDRQLDTRLEELTGSSAFGVTAGAGFETHFRRLAIAPVVRYTYWGRNSPDFPRAFLSFRNQIEVLGGIFILKHQSQ